MTTQKIRKDGNSLVVTIPREAARSARLEEGMPVQVRADEATGELHILALVPRSRLDCVKVGLQVIEEKQELLDRLAPDDSEKHPERPILAARNPSR